MEFLLAAVLIAAVVVLTPLSDRVRVPQPVLLTLFGLVLALVPGTPELHLEPDLILPVVLPPLLFAATQRTTAREFRDHAGAVLLLAVGLTVATAAVVALVVHLAGLPWSAAWVLGAIVSPPDPVAATAVARRLRLPDRLVTILEGEGMFNDATALVAFKVAVAATVTGRLSGPGTGLVLVVAVTVGIGIGLLAGWLTKLLLAAIEEANAETTLTVLAPFVAYVGAERLGGSGVLAVLFLGLFLRSQGHSATTSQGWLLGRSVWSYADFLITSLVFALLGYELVKVIGSTREHEPTVLLVGLVVTTLVVFRAAWVFVAAWLAGLRARRRDYPAPVGWRETTVVAWAGMRGVVTVATALALPATIEDGGGFPHRDEIVVVALSCVLLTLVVQGLTLGPLAGRLGVAAPDEGDDELGRLRRRAARAALEQVRSEPVGEAGGAVAPEVRRAAILQYEGYLAAQTAMADARRAELAGDRNATDQLDRILARAASVERKLVLEARTRGEVSAAAADEVLRDIEARALRDFG